jgi:hypothetical protein
MQCSPDQNWSNALGRAVRALDELTRSLDNSPRQVLAAGAALLDFASHEEDTFATLLPLIDPSARIDLAAEHERLAEDLDLLDWLVSTSPDSPDVAVLSESLARRIWHHANRDRRLLERSANLAE